MTCFHRDLRNDEFIRKLSDYGNHTCRFVDSLDSFQIEMLHIFAFEICFVTILSNVDIIYRQFPSRVEVFIIQPLQQRS